MVETKLELAREMTFCEADLAKRVEVPLSKLSFLEPLPPELLQDICRWAPSRWKDFAVR